jgi:DNA-binding NtrC family response regulator
MTVVLIVDDEKALRDALSEAVRDLGYEPVVASSGREALAIATKAKPDAALLDLRMPDMDGLQVLIRLRNDADGAKLPVAIITAYATAANTIEAMRLGAFDHLTKPVGRADLASLLERMVRSSATKALKPPPPDADSAPDDLIGSSNSMREVQKTIGLVADSDATVLITGETGTGKEVVARTIHRVGARSAGPFMALNCAAIPPDLLESELFVTSRAPSPAPSLSGRGRSVRRMAERYFCTRSATWTLRCRPRSCARYRSAWSRRSVAGRKKSTSVLSPPRTAIWSNG